MQYLYIFTFIARFVVENKHAESDCIFIMLLFNVHASILS